MSSLLEQARANRADLKVRLQRILNQAQLENRGLNAVEDSQYDAGVKELKAFEARIKELEDVEVRDNSAAAHMREIGSGWSVTSEPSVYRDPDLDPSSPSFFRDMRNARLGDYDAAERLRRNTQERGLETRAGDMTTVAGAGGEFAPPKWLVESFVSLARPGRVTANLLTRDTLPAGASSLNLPKVSTGTTTAVQATQNSALSDTAMTTTSVSSGITTVGGKQIISLQLLKQSGIPFDKVILQDLAADYAKSLDQQVIYGSNASGQLRGLVGVATNNAYTSATPKLTSATAADSFYNKVIAASAAIATARFLPATAIVMHPNRWAWCLEALDSQVRPVITADGLGYNGAGIATESNAQGAVGQLAKLPVYLDPNISLTANSATNQDEVYVLRAEDLFLWETDLMLDSFEATYADNASVLFRALGYAAFIPHRYAASVQSIRGTGLIAPVL